MLCSLVAYDDDYNVIATLDDRVVYDPSGRAIALVDFQAHEEAGREHLDLWRVERVTLDATGNEIRTPARGSKAWPEWLGEGAHDFQVELEGEAGSKRVAALVHRESGHRRERATVEAAIARRIAEAAGAPADIRDLVGGPDRPLLLDASGRTIGRSGENQRPDHDAGGIGP